MKLFLFSDIHASAQHCQKIAEDSTQADIVIGAGDIGHIRRQLPETIAILKNIKPPTILIPGNSESYQELKQACLDWDNCFVLHGDSVVIEGITFFGLGGGIPVTPFGSWSWDLSEEQARILLEKCPEKAVLVSHSPPKGLLDVSSSGQSLGSEAVREFIDKKKPHLVVCGHIHESSARKTTYGGTTVINAGPQGMWFEL